MNDVAKPEPLAGADLQRTLSQALDAALAEGVDAAEAAMHHDIGLSATARLGDVENLEYTNDRGIGITVYRDGRKGSASTSDFREDAIREAVAKASFFATQTAVDPHSGLADADRMCTDVLDLDLDYVWDIDADRAIELAVASEAAALASDKRLTNSEGATVSSHRGTRAYANSHGFSGAIAKSSHSLSCVVLGELDGDMQRDYYYTAARNPAELEDGEAVGVEAARRTIARLGARKIPTTRAPVLFVPELARGFIGHAIGALYGGAQYRQASFLLGAAGEQIFPDFVQVQERPHLPRGMASRSFDAEGVATSDRDLIADGVVQGYVLSSYSARRLGLETTGNAGGTHNLIIPGTGGNLESLAREMGSGLIVEELIGQGVNSVTGDYSRGAVGHWVENGEISHPVHEVTIAGNLRELYPRISAIGDDQDLRGGIRCGSVLVDEMTIAGS